MGAAGEVGHVPDRLVDRAGQMSGDKYVTGPQRIQLTGVDRSCVQACVVYSRLEGVAVSAFLDLLWFERSLTHWARKGPFFPIL